MRAVAAVPPQAAERKVLVALVVAVRAWHLERQTLEQQIPEAVAVLIGIHLPIQAAQAAPV